MFDQLFESYRKASESWLHMQQDSIRQFMQQWQSTPQNGGGASTEWNKTFQKRWIDLAVEALNKHRETLDSMYRSGIQIIEQTFRVSEAKTSDDYRRVVEELWRKLFETAKSQSETQFRDMQSWAEKSMQMAQNGQA